MPQPRALLSVYDKEGLADFAKALVERGYELVSSGGTAKALAAAGLPVVPVEKITGNPEAFDGRMKTLSFQIESAILFDRDNPVHRKEAQAMRLIPIDVVVCNFYPFKKALDENLDLKEAAELIDIGGPSLVRAAAKNAKHVLVVVDPRDYKMLAQLIRFKKEISLETRLTLAAKAFAVTADYDADIDAYFQKNLGSKVFNLRLQEGRKLRYGENPHQKGSVFWLGETDELSLLRFKQIAGKELSFNNLLDSDAAVNVLARLGGVRPACVIVKHANPCGAALGKNAAEAFQRAWEGDPTAAFGGVIALNRPLSAALVQKFIKDQKFAEIFLAPAVEKSALRQLAEKKKNLIVLVNPVLSSPAPSLEPDLKKIRGGLLVQEPDALVLEKKNLETVSKRSPSSQEWRDLLFAWNIARETKSNAVILAKNEQLVGPAAGQQDRLRACRLAVEKAGEKSSGAAAASDGFFPFPDGPEILLKSGVTAVIHPGGSIRDSETISVCDKFRAALVTTRGIRAFKH